MIEKALDEKNIILNVIKLLLGYGFSFKKKSIKKNGDEFRSG